MLHGSENHHLARLAASLLFAGGLLVTPLFFAGDAAAARGDKVYENAWACSTLFSRTPIRVQNGDDPETAICLGEGKKGRPPMSRADAWDLCKEQFDTTSQFIAWTGRGWHCRYYPR